MRPTTIMLIFFLCVLHITRCNGQEFGCPLEGAKLLSRDTGPYSHSDPTHSARILSLEQDNVQASLEGQVLDVIKSSGNFYTVIVRTVDVTIAYRHMQKTLVIKHQSVALGSSLGIAQKSDSVGYLLDISIWFGTEEKNASELLSCANKKTPE